MDFPLINAITAGRPAEIMPGIRTESEVVILDFSQIPEDLPSYKNIQSFFRRNTRKGVDPKTPEARQSFNDNFLRRTKKRYLIGRYGENRIEMLRGSRIASEGRTIHLGIDLFTQNSETLYAPFDGKVVLSGREGENHSYGNYCVLEHSFGEEKIYTFYGHLSSQLPKVGTNIRRNEPFASLGSYKDNENGGWSIHLHFQLLVDLAPIGVPIGYSTPNNFPENKEKFPDPNIILELPL